LCDGIAPGFAKPALHHIGGRLKIFNWLG